LFCAIGLATHSQGRVIKHESAYIFPHDALECSSLYQIDVRLNTKVIENILSRSRENTSLARLTLPAKVSYSLMVTILVQHGECTGCLDNIPMLRTRAAMHYYKRVRNSSLV